MLNVLHLNPSAKEATAFCTPPDALALPEAGQEFQKKAVAITHKPDSSFC